MRLKAKFFFIQLLKNRIVNLSQTSSYSYDRCTTMYFIRLCRYSNIKSEGWVAVYYC